MTATSTLVLSNSDFKPDELMSYEWLDTNQLGGYSSSTLSQAHSRKYHGLLVTNLSKPEGKYVMLSKLEDVLYNEHKEIYMTSHQYKNFFQTNGAIYLKKFIQQTHPVFMYQSEDFAVDKAILTLFEENTVLVKYSIKNSNFTKIKIKPLIACRQVHMLTFANQDLHAKTYPCIHGRKMRPYESLPELYFQTDSEFSFLEKADWYKNFEYSEEKKRGYADCEDLFTPGVFDISFNRNEIIFSCSTMEQSLPLTEKWNMEIKRRKKKLVKPKEGLLSASLEKVAPSFITRENQTHLTITAGYHWFDAWGRDTMIALPGLTLYTKDYKTFLAILKHTSSYEKAGLIPNIFSEDATKCGYNSVDTSLWFAWALQQYYYQTHDLDSIKQFFWETLHKIYYHYTKGTLYQIKTDTNGILYAGDNTTNITWMDAIVASVPVTPRHGAQVEVNALWYNFLCFLNELSIKIDGVSNREIKSRIKQFKKSFNEVFWDKQRGCLKDFVNKDENNASIRPNQIFAISLPYSPLNNKSQYKSILSVIKEHLFTPYGLRTLSPEDQNYVGRYVGNVYSRDVAYHNGTIWPWLLGPFTEGLLKIKSKKDVAEILQPSLLALQEHLYCAGLGTISEVFDGDFPHHPGGCISQAWNIAELLRVINLIK